MSPDQRNYHHGDLKRMLISTAEEIIAEQGVEAFTLRLLSRRIGVSHTAVYRHFDNKHELLCALAEKGFDELAARFQLIVPEDRARPLKHIRAIGRAYVQYALENPAHFRVMFGSALISPESPPALARAAGQVFNCLLEAVQGGQESGEVRSGDPVELTSVGWSMAHGLAQLLIDGQLMSRQGGRMMPALITGAGAAGDAERQRLIDVATEIMASGLAKTVDD